METKQSDHEERLENLENIIPIDVATLQQELTTKVNDTQIANEVRMECIEATLRSQGEKLSTIENKGEDLATILIDLEERVKKCEMQGRTIHIQAVTGTMD